MGPRRCRGQKYLPWPVCPQESFDLIVDHFSDHGLNVFNSWSSILAAALKAVVVTFCIANSRGKRPAENAFACEPC
jgi:hypothetical protein